MKTKENYDTVSEALTSLNKKGYTTDFRLNPQMQCLVCNHTSANLSPDEFEIDAIYRFEGNTDPGDEMIVYAISSSIHKLKGIVINGYGLYSDSTTNKIVARLHKAI
ncbi:MAG TPA: phosphoribosylpyrophosphate synthetase [Salinimicrobium sp.]|nr:phosphoribosylpyrophosphate synthetase [Salinimicrobium sp.]